VIPLDSSVASERCGSRPNSGQTVGVAALALVETLPIAALEDPESDPQAAISATTGSRSRRSRALARLIPDLYPFAGYPLTWGLAKRPERY
jgi:hypothetical protein